MKPTMAAASLRALGDAIANGGQKLELFTDKFFAVENGWLQGCCALGSAYLTIDPTPLCRNDLPDDFGDDNIDGVDGVTNTLYEHFPVLQLRSLAASFVQLSDQALSADETAELAEGTLLMAIAGVFDRTSAGFQEIKTTLYSLAQKVESAEVAATA